METAQAKVRRGGSGVVSKTGERVLAFLIWTTDALQAQQARLD